MRSGGPISPGLRRFISERIRSLEELEILMLLSRTQDRWWSQDEVASTLHLGTRETREGLERLSGGFLDVRVTSDVNFRFAPINAEREALSAELAEAYERNRTEVVRQIAVGASGAVRDFADAFKLKGDA